MSAARGPSEAPTASNEPSGVSNFEPTTAHEASGASSSEPTFEELMTIHRSLSQSQQRAVCGLVGTAIGDVVGVPFELYSHKKNRELIAPYQKDPSMSGGAYSAYVLSLVAHRMRPSAGSPFGRTFSDDTVCTDIKMQAIAMVALTCAKSDYKESTIFESMMQEYLTWAHAAGGSLFQGYGAFTKDLLWPSRGNRLGQLKINLWKADSDFAPTAEFLTFAKEHFEGTYPGGFPSWGNGAVMSFSPALLFETNHGAGQVAKVLSGTHLERTAVIAADLLAEVLGCIHSNNISSCKEISQAVLQCASWRDRVLPMKAHPRDYIFPLAAFEEFLTRGDCDADTANSYLTDLITKSGMTLYEKDILQGPAPYGHFGHMLRIASNFDDDDSAERKGIRLTVAGSPEECVRFSQRALNSVIIAIWCAHGSTTCWDWLQRVLYVGGDADTVGAVTGQIACPLLDVEDVFANFRRFVALDDPLSADQYFVNAAAARRFWHRCILFAQGRWADMLSTRRLADPAYEGLTTADGMRLAAVTRIPCKFGSKCYETKRSHKNQYCHPGDDDWLRNCCRYGEKCYDKSLAHVQEFTHPGEWDWNDRALVAAGRGRAGKGSHRSGKGSGR